MPASRPRPQNDDSRSEASSTKERAIPAITQAVNGKARRPERTTTIGSSLRDVITVGTTSTVGGDFGVLDPILGIQWSSFDGRVLQGYRNDYRLNTPAAFNQPYNQLVLSRSPIGRLSPTMARHREQRRQSKEQLAHAVRRHFNSMGINENDVVVDFLYKVRWQDKHFRMRFTPAQ